MTSLAHLLVSLTYAAAAVTVGSALWRFTALGSGASWLAAGLAALAAAQIHALFIGRAERRDLAQDLNDLRESHRLLIEEAEEARNKLQMVEYKVEAEAAARHTSLVEEVRALEELVRDMGSRLNARTREAPRYSSSVVDRTTATGRAMALNAVRGALDAGRIDLCLQPIVTLPQRKTYFYESFSRLRDQKGSIIAPSDWLPVAEPAGLLGTIDNLLLFRCVQIVRRLSGRDRRVGMFCNVSTTSLGDDTFFPQLLDYLRGHADMASSIIFELGHADFEERSAEAARNMTRLSDFGFRFSLDKLHTLDVDPTELKRAGVRFMKAPGEVLLERLNVGEPLGLSAAPEVRAEDYSELLAKFGVELIAEKVEEETTVVELLELDIPFGQGHLFGEPRPVRVDVLEAADAVRAASGAAAA